MYVANVNDITFEKAISMFVYDMAPRTIRHNFHRHRPHLCGYGFVMFSFDFEGNKGILRPVNST